MNRVHISFYIMKYLLRGVWNPSKVRVGQLHEVVVSDIIVEEVILGMASSRQVYALRKGDVEIAALRSFLLVA